MKFTFKKERPTGRYSSFDAISYHIKLKRKRCGVFYDNIRTVSKIYLSVEKTEEINDNNPNCSWMNISLKKKFKTVEETKKFLIDNTEKINKKYKLHFFDN